MADASCSGTHASAEEEKTGFFAEIMSMSFLVCGGTLHTLSVS